MGKNRRSRKRVEEASSNNKKVSEETKEAGQGEEEGPTICLYVQHLPEDMHSSMYTIRLPHNLSEHDEYQMIEVSDSDSKQNTILSFRERDSFLHQTVLANIGSKIYFLGGKIQHAEKNKPASELETLSRRVQVIDINDPEQKIQSVAPMHTSKDSPCVFVADSMIYAIGTNQSYYNTKLPGCEYTGLFERYNPSTDCWHVLPDPPNYQLFKGGGLLDCATVIGSRVIIGCPEFHAVFDLKNLVWDCTQLQQATPLFPFGSVFVQRSESGYLYHLSGAGIPRLVNPLFNRRSDCPFRGYTAVTRFPLPTPITEVRSNSLVMAATSSYCKKQKMAQASDLDDNKPFTKRGYVPWRFFFHVGGYFFCYVVTAQLFDQLDNTQYEPFSRAVFIKFFKEVTDGSKTKFQPVASFCYKFKTKFFNVSGGTRCSVIRTVPDSWINSPPKKKQESFAMRTEREQSQVGQTSCPELEKAVNDQPYETRDLEKLLAEISFLKAELAAKEKLLRTEILRLGGEGRHIKEEFFKAYDRWTWTNKN